MRIIPHITFGVDHFVTPSRRLQLKREVFRPQTRRLGGSHLPLSIGKPRQGRRECFFGDKHVKSLDKGDAEVYSPERRRR